MILWLLGSAAALDLQWWGVGPVVGTMVIPTKYPTALPFIAQDKVDKVRGDVEVGAHGVLYPGKAGRIFGRFTFGFGTSGYFSPEFVAGYDAILFKDDELQVLFGAGLGAGSETFRSAGENDHLRVNYFPIRAETSVLLRDRSRAYEISLWGDLHIASNQEYCTSKSGDCTNASDTDEAIAGAVYFGLGAEATLYFGDFKSKGGGQGKKK